MLREVRHKNSLPREQFRGSTSSLPPTHRPENSYRKGLFFKNYIACTTTRRRPTWNGTPPKRKRPGSCTLQSPTQESPRVAVLESGPGDRTRNGRSALNPCNGTITGPPERPAPPKFPTHCSIYSLVRDVGP